MSEITQLNQILIDDLLSVAKGLPRQRKNHNFHDTLDHPCQRLVNVMLADAYIAPHRHLNPAKDEMMVILRGRLGMVYFDDTGAVTGTHVLEAGGECLAVNIPVGTYHSCVALSEGAAFFETKAGPYAPHKAEELATFAPSEGAAEAPAFLARMKALFAQHIA